MLHVVTKPYQRRSDGRWLAAIEVGTGKQRKRRFVTGKTERAVKVKLARLRTLPRPTDALEGWLSVWLDQLRVKDRTKAGYATIIDHHIVPVLGDIQIGELTAGDVRAWMGGMERKFHPRTVGHAHAVLRASLNRAVKDRMIDFNPAAAVEAPRVARRAYTVWTTEQQRAFLASVTEDPLEALYRLALTTGMRQGELLGLRWSDVNLDGGTLTVNQVLVRMAGDYTFPEPKTAQSRRTIPLAPRTVASLRRRKAQQAANRLPQAKRWKDRDLVFTLDGGEPLPNWWVTGEFQRRAAEAKLPRVRFHDMRHMAASHLIESGADLALVREILGHSTITTTVDIYGHLTAGRKRSALDTISEALG